MEKMILVTNDDGYDSEGVKVLYESLKEIGEVFLVAPKGERSATSHSISLNQPIYSEKVDSHRYIIDGTPTDCVMLGVKKLLPRKPDLVVAGINCGPNMGEDITYSGTVNAALEGALMRIPSFSISMAAREDFLFEVGAEFARNLSKVILNDGMPKNTLLNVNVPNIERKFIRGVSVSKQGCRIYRDEVIQKEDELGRVYFMIEGDEPGWEDRDRVVLSAGHYCPVLYAVLAEAGFFEKKRLDDLRKLGSGLQGHPHKKPSSELGFLAW